MDNLPDPGSTFVDGAVKYAVEKSCTAVMDRTITGASEADKDVVVNQICDVVNFTTDAILQARDGKLPSEIDTGIFLANQNVNLAKLSKNQQVLCGHAVVHLAINGYQAVNEYRKTYVEAQTMAEFGAIGGPELSAAFGLATVAAHGPALYSNTDSFMNAGYEVWARCFDQSAKLANAALDAHSQSGPLAFDRTFKPRDGDLACRMPDDEAPNMPVQPNASELPDQAQPTRLP